MKSLHFVDLVKIHTHTPKTKEINFDTRKELNSIKNVANYLMGMKCKIKRKTIHRLNDQINIQKKCHK